MTEQVEHVEQPRTIIQLSRSVGQSCSCGARWTQPIARAPEMLDSIFESHVKYARRTETKPD